MREAACQSFWATDLHIKTGAKFPLRSKFGATIAAAAPVIALGVPDYVTGPLLTEKQVELEQTLDPNLPPVDADPEQIWEALQNLIRNAVEAMPHGGKLTVTTKQTDSKALIYVGDNGHGMTAEEARNLFVPFFTTKRNGTGLGLAHTLQIINEHAGKVDYPTAPGKGSTFMIELPLRVGP